MGKIRKMYRKLLKRLPSTCPHAKLIIHKNLITLRKDYWKGEQFNRTEPYAFCNSVNYTIHVPSSLAESSYMEIAYYLLHELGHLYALKKHGQEKFESEKFANDYAGRWLRQLGKELWW